MTCTYLTCELSSTKTGSYPHEFLCRTNWSACADYQPCHGDSKSAGVSIMFRSGLDFKVNDLKIDENGRYIILDLTVYEQRLTFVCLYGYNTDVPQFFTDILYKSAEFANTSYLFCGDWNAVQNKSDDTYNVLHDRNINARKKIDEMKETFELLDPWHTCYPDDRKYTWHQPSPVK